MNVQYHDQIGEFFAVDAVEVVERLRNLQLLPRNKRCKAARCRRYCNTVRDANYSLNVCFKCPGCKRKYRLTEDTFFADMRMEPLTIFTLLWFWVNDIPAGGTAGVLGVERHAVYRLFMKFRETCTWYLEGHPEELVLGGQGQAVQIDESMFSSPKHHRGRPMKSGWLFGMYGETERRGVAKFVEDRNKETLTNVLLEFVRPGTEVVSDGWKAYRTLNHLGRVSPYKHVWVNHSEHFVDPVTGYHTNAVEAYWSVMKRWCRKMAVKNSRLIPSHLDQFQWRQLYCRTNSEGFSNMLAHIALRYPV